MEISTTKKTKPIKKIAISTGGGDAPGLNGVIRAVVLASLKRGWECIGIRDGFNGIMMPEKFKEGGTIRLDRDTVRGISHLGGTILGTANRGNPMNFPIVNSDGSVTEVDRSDELIASLNAMGVDALVTIGGDGSLTIGHHLYKKGLRVVGVPKTIDNDIERTVVTFGFDTALTFATECLDRLHTTAESHHRVIVVEVMGRHAGWIALNSGIAGTAHAILIPEIPYDLKIVTQKIRDREKAGRSHSIVIVAEGALPKGGEISIIAKELGRADRLGGIGEKVGRELQEMTGKETRVVVLGHLLRGGTPTSFDRLTALRFGAAAVRALEAGESGIMVAMDPPNINYVPLSEAASRMKTVPLDCDSILTARDLGMCFGD